LKIISKISFVKHAQKSSGIFPEFWKKKMKMKMMKMKMMKKKKKKKTFLSVL